MTPKKPRPKKCKACGKSFVPWSTTAICCSWECAHNHVVAKRQKEEQQAEKEARKAIRVAKERLKRRSEWTQEAQRAVNAYRRNEELAKGRGCISCGRTQEQVMATDGWKPGGAWDAGHFMSVGHMPAKRFDYRNIWLQCKSCNAGSSKYARKGATVSKQFRENLIALEGLELVEEMERDSGAAKWTIEELKAIKADAVARLKALNAAARQTEYA